MLCNLYCCAVNQTLAAFGYMEKLLMIGMYLIVCYIVSYISEVCVMSLQAVATMVEECCKYVNQTPDLDTKLKLIDTLITVSKGKVRPCTL